MRRSVAQKIYIPTTKVKVTIEGHRFVTCKSCASHNSKTNKGNLIEFYTKVRQNEKACRAQTLGSHGQCQGRS